MCPPPAWLLALALSATPAERAGYAATTPHAAVLDYCQRLDRSPRIRQFTFGTSGEGRPLPALAVAPADIATPEEAAARGVPVVVAFANIHAGEVDGKEALLALARDYAAAPPGSPLAEQLQSVTLVLIPDLNADGNERFGHNRRTQNGPELVGERANAQGLDLNRDFVKLESPEARALVKLLNAWQPVAVIDCHTTNGSYHRYTLTYDAARHPAAGAGLVAAGESLLAAVQTRIKAATGFDTFPYGDFADNHAKWVSYPALPRYGVQAFGLRGELGVLSESYSYAPFRDRVRASRALVAGVVAEVAADPKRFTRLAAEARKPRPRVAVRSKSVPRDAAETVLGYVEVVKDGQSQPTDTTKDYRTTRIDKVVATREVPTPGGYLVPPDYRVAIDTLLRHGVAVEEVAEEAEVEAEAFVLAEVARAARAFQGHELVTLEGQRRPAGLRVRPGWFLVRTAQPLGNLAAFLLEPESEDGLAAWNAFDAGLKVGEPYPVRSLKTVPRLVTAAAAPPAADAPAKRRVAVADLLKPGGQTSGSSPRLPEWLDAGHFLQSVNGTAYRVEARTGKSVPLADAKLVAKSLKALGDIPKAARQQALNPRAARMNPARTGTLVELGSDLAFVPFDGSPAVRLSTSPGERPKPEFAEFSPDGSRVAYVRGGDLYAVALADPKELRLTTDGDAGPDGVLNGKADWVYEEEIFNRADRGTFRWHPTEAKLVFLRLDDKPVTPFHLVSPFGASGKLETIPYPKAGGANPLVSVQLADAATGKVETLPLGSVDPKSTLVARVGWLATPGGAVPFAYVQNRTQTYLDFVTWPTPGAAKTLFRETTGAWVEDLGEPHALPGGDFLVLSERTGFKHLYRVTPEGKSTPLTAGEFEVRTVERVDADAGRAWVTTTRAGPTRTHLETVPLAGGELTRVSPEAGTHASSVAPAGGLYIDRASSPTEPGITMLRDAAGGTLRTLDATPARGLDAFKLGASEHVRVPMPDGTLLSGVLTYPPDFDPNKKYPLWLLTYAGPHAPTVRGDFSPRLREQAIAAMGVVAFDFDPRSASGDGAKSAWVAYKRLYESELADLSAAVAWVGTKGWLDDARVGLSGHSYGGSITAFALTHPSPFTAGVAGAPVTDWRLYDSIYTERYMLTPAENPKGYDQSSSVKAAAGLHGRLLICHGLVDDNVHFQNTAQLVEALEKAGKTEFEVAIYPSSRHGIRSSHYVKSQMDFIRRTMGR